MIAVTFALPAESSDFVRRLDRPKRRAFTVSGEIDNREVTVVHTGVGRAAAARNIETYLQSEQPQWIVSAGFAGALTNDSEPGQLVIGANVSDAALAERAQTILPAARPLQIVTVDSIVDQPGERAALAQAGGAEAIEMETQIIAQACAARGIPLLSLRVISDAPARPFPAPPAVLFDVVAQRTNIARLAGYLITHPQRIPRLISFARRIGQARATLANALRELIQNV